MLAVVAVMLGLNLIVGGAGASAPQEAIAAGPVQPVPVSITSSVLQNKTVQLVRLWSDGHTDTTVVQWGADICSPPSACSGPSTIIPGTCAADVNCDGIVGVADLLLLFSAWGPCPDCDNCPADLDGDCTVGVADLLILFANWG